MEIKAILLDLDGTILNTLSDLTDSVNYMLEKFGFPTHSELEIRSIVGNGAKNLITRSLPERTSDEKFEDCLSVFKKHYEKNKANKTAPYDGIPESLAELKKKGYLLAIVSNKHNDAVLGLKKQFFDDSVSYAIGNIDSIPKKPAPDMLYHTLEQLGVAKENAVYVGDSEVDVTTAKNAGIPCISVTWGFRDRDCLTESGATLFVDSPKDLVEAIENL